MPTYTLGQGAQPASLPASDTDLTRQLVTQLDLEQRQLAIEDLKSRRLWAMVAGLATLTTALVGVLTYVNSRRR